MTSLNQSCAFNHIHFSMLRNFIDTMYFKLCIIAFRQIILLVCSLYTIGHYMYSDQNLLIKLGCIN